MRTTAPPVHNAVESPHGFEQWLLSLQQQGIGTTFQDEVGAWLRVIAATKNAAVILVSGTEAAPYANWMQDGMSMSSRLILHNRSSQVLDSLRPHFTTDIRAALHQQELAGFLADIEEHKFDFVLVDVDDIEAAAVPMVMERVSEQGLLIGVGAAASLQALIQTCVETCFFAYVGVSAGCVVISRKGLQHRAVRRGGRRRHGTSGTGRGFTARS